MHPGDRRPGPFDRTGPNDRIGPNERPGPRARPKRAPRAPVSGYDPGLCAEVVEIMGEGYSLTAFAGHIGVSRSTVSDWIKAYPDFAAAVERARAARACRLEDEFLEGGTGAKVAAHVFALKNAAPDDWRERPEAETGPKGPEIGFIMPENGRRRSAEEP